MGYVLNVVAATVYIFVCLRIVGYDIGNLFVTWVREDSRLLVRIYRFLSRRFYRMPSFRRFTAVVVNVLTLGAKSLLLML